jgi:hypothetical protein
MATFFTEICQHRRIMGKNTRQKVHGNYQSPTGVPEIKHTGVTI